MAIATNIYNRALSLEEQLKMIGPEQRIIENISKSLITFGEIQFKSFYINGKIFEITKTAILKINFMENENLKTNSRWTFNIKCAKNPSLNCYNLSISSADEAMRNLFDKKD